MSYLSYLKHDLGAIRDEKILRLIGEMGWEGYGIFFRLLEILHDSADHQISIEDDVFPVFAKMNGLPEEATKKVLQNFDLFIISVDHARSARVDRLFEELQERFEKKQKAGRLGGIKSGKSRSTNKMEAKRSSASIAPKQNEQDKIRKDKIRKDKKIGSSERDVALALAVTEVILYFNEVTGKSLKDSGIQNRKHILARLREGFTLEDCKKVIRVKFEEWRDDDKMSRYIRIETLFGSKFESYLQQDEIKPKTGIERFMRDD